MERLEIEDIEDPSVSGKGVKADLGMIGLSFLIDSQV